MEYLSQFSFTIEYIKGKDNCVADALSRVSSIKHVLTLEDSDWPEHMILVLVGGEYPEKCPDDLREKLKNEQANFEYQNEVLYRIVNGK